MSEKNVPIVPVRDMIVVKREKMENTSPGGVIVTTVAGKAPDRGVVLAIGPGRILDDGSRVDLAVSVGDRVIFRPESGHRVIMDDTGISEEDEIVVMQDMEVLAIVK